MSEPHGGREKAQVLAKVSCMNTPFEDGPAHNWCLLMPAHSYALLPLTGPNASGKSCYAKQVALIAYLAHTGSFVPAKRAVVGVVDRVGGARCQGLWL